MANTQALSTQFKADIMNGKHAMGTTVTRGATTADTYKAALYNTTASIGAGTSAYTATGECSGTGYTAGGITFAWAAPSTSGTTGFTTPSASLVYTTVTIGPTDCVLLYNSSQSNIAVGAWTFTAQSPVAGTLTITMPTNGAGTAALNLA